MLLLCMVGYMSRLFYILLSLLVFTNIYAINNLNTSNSTNTGMYVPKMDSIYYSNNKVIDDELSQENLPSPTSNRATINTDNDSGIDITTHVDKKYLITGTASGAVNRSKFYISETKFSKKLLGDSFELYGATDVGGNISSSNELTTYAGAKSGVKYNVSDNLNLSVEGQYDITGQAMSDNIMSSINSNTRGSTSFQTGLQWDFA